MSRFVSDNWLARLPVFRFGKFGMGFGVRSGIIAGAALMLVLPLPRSWAAPQNTKIDDRLRNIKLCNGADRRSPEPQINGCTALINGPHEPALILAIAHNNRGNAYSTQRDYDRAIKDYDLAITLNPNYAKPYNNRGVAYQKKGDYDRAIKDFDEAIKLSPNYGHAFANRAETYLKKNDYERAAQDYDEAIRLEPKSGAARS